MQKHLTWIWIKQQGNQKVNEECNLVVGVDDNLEMTIIFCLLYLRVNGMTGWMVRNFISRDANIVSKICKTQIRPHIKYCTWAWLQCLDMEIGVCNIEIGEQRRMTKII